MRATLLLLALTTLASAALYAPPEPPTLPPLPPLPGTDASPLATQLTLTPDQAAAAKATAVAAKNASVVALTNAKAAVNASVSAAASKLNATLAAKEKLFSDAVLLPGGGLSAGGLRGGGLLKKANWTDGLLSSELAFADGVKTAVTDAKARVSNAFAARKVGQ